MKDKDIDWDAYIDSIDATIEEYKAVQPIGTHTPNTVTITNYAVLALLQIHSSALRQSLNKGDET